MELCVCICMHVYIQYSDQNKECDSHYLEVLTMILKLIYAILDYI